MSGHKYEWKADEMIMDILSSTITSRASVVRLHGEDIDWYLRAPMKEPLSLDDDSTPVPKNGTWFITAIFKES